MQTFELQVEALTGITIDSSSTAPTQTQLSDFLTDGASEVINSMPMRLKYLCATHDTFNSAAVGSEAEVLKSGEVLAVSRTDGTVYYPCREIPANLAGRVSDSTFATGHMESATQTDPAYYIYNGKINSIPAALANGSAAGNKYLELVKPTVLYSHNSMDDSVTSFPLEYEYLIPLYASVKALQNAMAAKSGNTSITSSLSALNQCIINAGTEIGLAKAEAAEIAAYTDTASGSNIETAADGIATAVSKFQADGGDPALFGDETQYVTGDGLKRVNTALDLAIRYVNDDFPHADYDLAQNLADIDGQLNDEDTELAAGRVQQAQTTMSAISTQINLAQAHIADWNAAVSALQSEIAGFSSEVSSRSQLVGTKVQSVQSYVNTATTYLSQASANANEIQVRLSVDTTEYGWMEKQQAKLQSDYDRGISKMSGQTT